MQMEWEFHPLANLYPLSDQQTLENLAADIKANGLHFAVTVYEGKILDGRNRAKACAIAGVKPHFEEFKGNYSEAFEFVRAANIQRRDLTASQRAAIAVFKAGPEERRIIVQIKAEAKERQVELGRNLRTLKEAFPEGSGGQSRDQIGKRYNVSGRYISDLETVAQAIAGLDELEQKPEPEWADLASKYEGLRFLPDEVFNGNKTVADAKREMDRLAYEIRVVEAEIERRAVPQLVLADPPWKYDDNSPSRRLENQYDTATVDEIISHKPLTASDCILFLWATPTLLREALAVLEAWGFEYRTNFVWDKEVPGMGHWARFQHELLLVGTKGEPELPLPDLLVSSVFREKRREHSRKPEAVYQWIESTFGDLRRLEMYCRKARKGWAVSGNEV
jgi:N6-adenosine-specific RNA methylase IME4